MCKAFVAAACLISGCDGSGSPNARVADSANNAGSSVDSQVRAPTIQADTANRTLAGAAGTNGYVVDSVPSETAAGSLSGTVTSAAPLPPDSMVSPTGDLSACEPFLDVTMPSDNNGARIPASDTTTRPIGNAIVWLVGVSHGPRDATSRRVMIRLDGCTLQPRVQRAPAGATINVGTRDAMISRLRFVEMGQPLTQPRAIIDLTDAGQVVPTTQALATPGLVEVRDDRHPWVRGYIAVAPHPFVAVTDASGLFVFEGVPVGEYTLVAWHERLGTRVEQVTVRIGAASVKIRY